MFHTDTRPACIDLWDFDAAAGAIANRTRIATLSDAEGRPDGGATDMEGHYWSAGTSAACINRFSPAGELVGKVVLPVPGPSMPCFAEDWIYVTTLRGGRSAETLAANPTMGGLFRFRSPVAGAPVALFADS